jgi:hypothetical protein
MLYNQKTGYNGVDQKSMKFPAPPVLNNTINPGMTGNENQNGEPVKKKRGRKPIDRSAQN